MSEALGERGGAMTAFAAPAGGKGGETGRPQRRIGVSGQDLELGLFPLKSCNPATLQRGDGFYRTSASDHQPKHPP